MFLQLFKEKSLERKAEKSDSNSNFIGSRSLLAGKARIPVTSTWLPSVVLQNFEFVLPFPLNLKQCL